jgi:hypothetical protein
VNPPGGWSRGLNCWGRLAAHRRGSSPRQARLPHGWSGDAGGEGVKLFQSFFMPSSASSSRALARALR